MSAPVLRVLPRYRSHKEVQALKITGVLPNPRGYELHFGDAWVPVEVPVEWVAKHAGGRDVEAMAGGYFVVYADGYQSWSPAAAFEGGYRAITEPVVDVEKLAGIARKFIDDNRVSCAEATTNDRVYENAPELVEKLADVVGYYRYPEDGQ